MKRNWIFVAILCAVFLTHASAQLKQVGPKLIGTGAVGVARQGGSVCVSADGNTAIVGGASDSSLTGAAWIFTRSGGLWSQQGAKLVGTGAVGAAQQGVSVSISSDGNTAIVGGYSDNSGIGAAWVFTRNGGVWAQQGAKLVGTGVVGNASQGYSASLSSDGNTALVGGAYDNNGAGATWIFTRSGGVWTQQGSKLVGTGALGQAYQGSSSSVSSDGNTAIIGGYNDNNGAGAAWIFTRSGGVWTQQGPKLVGTGAVGSADQGTSVSISSDGNTAIVGGDYDNSIAGAAWIFTRSGGVWTQQGPKLVGTGAVGSADQGYSVAISSDGNTAIVGGDNDNGGAGTAWIFKRNGGVWTQQGSKLVGTGAVGQASQGISVSISSGGNAAIIGGNNDNNGAGAAWIYMDAPPNLRSVNDMTSDPGGTVVIDWDKSILDVLVSTVVTEYWVWRGIRAVLAPFNAVVLSREEYLKSLAKHEVSAQTFMSTGKQEGDSPLAGDIYWQYIISLPSLGLDHYSYSCPTLADSTSQGTPWRYFFITARTNDPNIYWSSQPDSGYSVDNLSPFAPGNAALAALTGTKLRLRWDRDLIDPDVGHYTVYRSLTGGFPLADSTRWGITADTVMVDSTVSASEDYYYRVTTVDIHGNESAPSAQLYSPNALSSKASIKVMLEGPYNSGTLLMNKTLRTGGFLAAHFGSIPIPTDAVDSINIELRNASSASASTTRKFRPAWLLTDGSIRDFFDTTANCVTFDTLAGNYYLVITHRNHIAIMTAATPALNGAVPSSPYDFTTAQSQAYGSNPMKAVTGGRFAMIAGDASGNGQVATSDVNTFIRPRLGQSGYQNADINLNGQIQTSDINTYARPNLGKGTQVPASPAENGKRKERL